MKASREFSLPSLDFLRYLIRDPQAFGEVPRLCGSHGSELSGILGPAASPGRSAWRFAIILRQAISRE